MDADVEETRDTYYREWYRKQFELLNFETNKFKCEVVDLMQQVKLYRKEVRDLRADREQDKATIGMLMERMDKYAAVVKKLQNDIKECRPLKGMEAAG